MCYCFIKKEESHELTIPPGQIRRVVLFYKEVSVLAFGLSGVHASVCTVCGVWEAEEGGSFRAPSGSTAGTIVTSPQPTGPPGWLTSKSLAMSAFE